MEICLIFNYVLDFIYSQHIYSHIFTVHYTIAEWAHGIKLFWHLENVWLQPSLFMGKEYLCQIDWVYDGTVLRISRPNSNQQILFNGHKRIHGVKFQSLALPNGLTVLEILVDNMKVGAMTALCYRNLDCSHTYNIWHRIMENLFVHMVILFTLSIFTPRLPI